MYDGMLSFKVKSLIYENASELLYNLDTASVREKIANAICRYSDIFPYKSVDDVIKVLKDNSESILDEDTGAVHLVKHGTEIDEKSMLSVIVGSRITALARSHL